MKFTGLTITERKRVLASVPARKRVEVKEDSPWIGVAVLERRADGVHHFFRTPSGGTTGASTMTVEHAMECAEQYFAMGCRRPYSSDRTARDLRKVALAYAAVAR